MRTICYLVIGFFLLVSSTSAHAQGIDVGVIGAALITIEAENSYVGYPYLDDGLGGRGPGVGVSFDVSARNGFTAVAEFSSARLKAVQQGRLVDGGPVTTTFTDSILTGMIGWAKGSQHRFTLLAGVGRSFGLPALDGAAIEDFDFDDGGRLVLTAGLNAAHHLSSRISLVGTARYARVSRTTAVEQLGISEHVYRFGGGLRFRLNP